MDKSMMTRTFGEHFDLDSPTYSSVMQYRDPYLQQRGLPPQEGSQVHSAMMGDDYSGHQPMIHSASFHPGE